MNSLEEKVVNGIDVDGMARLVSDVVKVSRDEYAVEAVRKAHQKVFGRDPEIGAVPPHNYGGTDASVWLDVAGVPAAIYDPGGGGSWEDPFHPPNG